MSDDPMSDGVKINHSQNDTILTQLVAETTANIACHPFCQMN